VKKCISGLEQEDGRHVYPDLGTVTYLTDEGGPTVIINKKGSQSITETFTGPLVNCSYVLSNPARGKHITFKGDLLHAASSDFLKKEGFLHQAEDEEIPDDEDEDQAPKRVTFLVNIWLDHIPTHATKLNTILSKHLASTCGAKASGVSVTLDDGTLPISTIEMTQPARELYWNFVSSNTNCNVILPVPATSDLFRVMLASSSVLVVTDAMEQEQIGSLSEVIICGTCFDDDDDDDDDDDGDDDDDDDDDDDEEVKEDGDDLESEGGRIKKKRKTII
jgi:hypothetical protein